METLSRGKPSSVQSVLATPSSWHLLLHSYGAAHSHSLLSLSHTHSTSTQYVMFNINTLFALGVFIRIHHLGQFTNTTLKDTLTLFADMVLSRFRPIRLLSESIKTDSDNQFDYSAKTESNNRFDFSTSTELLSSLRFLALS